jgi:hypothetical protein
MEHEYTPAQLNAYNALKYAAERIAAGIWKAYRTGKQTARIRAGYALRTMPVSSAARGGPTSYLIVDSDLKKVQTAMGDVLAGTITPESAMALLHEYDILNKRTS